MGDRSNKNEQKMRSDIALWVFLVGTVISHSASALEFETGNSDWSIRLDNTIKGSSGMRVGGRQSAIANNPTFDESDYKFDRGDFVTNRIDLLSELDITYQRVYGVRVSGAGWYDAAYNNKTSKQNPTLAAAGYSGSYFSNKYSKEVERFYNGPSGELLDAFAFGKIDVGDSPINFKIGQHAISWGTSTFDFFQNGIAYGQAPIDGRKAQAVPGSTLKEILLPVAQASAQWSATPSLSLAAQVMLHWRPSRFPEGGTYFGSADFLFSGPDQFPLAPGLNVPRQSPLTPKKAFNGSFGTSVAWSPEILEGGTLTGYYRQFDDPTPWLAPQVLLRGVLPTGYRMVYPKDIRMVGTSLNVDIGGYSVGTDISFRSNAPLLASGISPVDNEGPRGDTAHVNLNAVGGLTPTALYDTGTFIAELSYERLMSVTKHAELFNGVGYGGCSNGTRTGPGSKRDGCASRDFVGIGVQFSPQWLQVLPGIDLTMPLTASYGLYGNGATSLSGSQGSYTYSASLKADIRQAYTATLTYAKSHADINQIVNGVAISGNGNYAGNDRSWVSLSVQTTF
ncbi:hypothetical protein AZL_b06140 (plasmid) [Azospirillum sp. B510]|uniref:DUF1302 domain-containing protein n=1 Tax=Azospirillum sp. (strain B510) TaxID=137722 RepID=UPI0001C4CA49|nr:DUF1302 family protein [Azospirillum sp. B510]BAI75277.1 hypothetical protein AZL_b06140 [Azospirillum sp. B510]